MADAFSPPSPPPAPAPSPSPIAADDLADARLAPWTTSFSPWPAPRGDHASGGGRANPLFTILPVSALAIGLVLLVAVAVILAVTRRARPRQADASGSCSGDGKPGAPPSSCGSHNTRCGYAAAGKCYSTTEFAVCPAVAILGSIFSHDWIVFFFLFCWPRAAGTGCIYAGRLVGFSAAQPRSRGAQVFTYRELERATDGFSECNVVGRGASGAVFRGRLADGTTAAIKRLRLDHRRQGEREFRIEVSQSSQATLHPARRAHTRRLQLTPPSMCTSTTYVALRFAYSSYQPYLLPQRAPSRGSSSSSFQRLVCVPGLGSAVGTAPGRNLEGRLPACLLRGRACVTGSRASVTDCSILS